MSVSWSIMTRQRALKAGLMPENKVLGSNRGAYKKPYAHRKGHTHPIKKLTVWGLTSTRQTATPR